jgi:nucleoid-associated protein YgaU
MTTDLKTGMALGLLAALVALFWISARTEIGVRLGLSREADQEYVPLVEPDFSSDTRGVPLSVTTDAVRTDMAADDVPHPNVPDTTIYEQDEPIKTEKFHIVRREETLSDISRRYYGSPGHWRKIVEANRDVITDANVIKPGTKLIIPDLD